MLRRKREKRQLPDMRSEVWRHSFERLCRLGCDPNELWTQVMQVLGCGEDDPPEPVQAALTGLSHRALGRHVRKAENLAEEIEKVIGSAVFVAELSESDANPAGYRELPKRLRRYARSIALWKKRARGRALRRIFEESLIEYVYKRTDGWYFEDLGVLLNEDADALKQRSRYFRRRMTARR